MATPSDHDHEHDNDGTGRWDFPPLYPSPVEEPPVGEIPDEGLPEDPTDHEAFMDWVESQCDTTNDKQPVEQYDGTLGVSKSFVDNHESPVGLIQWNDDLDQRYSDPGRFAGDRWCTGTLVADDLFLTAGHCFDSAPGVPVKGGQRIRPHEIATNMHVDFNYQVDPSGNLRQEQQFDIVELVERDRGGLDYAVVRLSGTPGNRFGSATLATSPVQQGDSLCIIQHPRGRPKKIEAGTATHVHTSSTSGQLGEDYFGYGDIDTLRGSSGSGVLRESDGAIVGVHTNGGCRAGRGGHNHGVKIGPILNESDVLTAFSLKNPIEGKIPLSEKNFPSEKMKFTDEGVGGNKFLNDPPVGTGGRGTVKHVDDRKATGLDKPPGDPAGQGGGVGGDVPGAGGGLEYTPTRPYIPEKNKFTDEPGGTLPFRDTPIGGGDGGTSPYIDRRKATGLDKQFDDMGLGQMPFSPIQQQGQRQPQGYGYGFGHAGGSKAGGGERPFVLQTPHHVGRGSGADLQGTGQGQGQGQPHGHGGTDRTAGGGGGELQSTYEQLLSDMQQFLQQQQTQLQAINDQYRQLAAEYQQFLSQGSQR
ncbi:serine protease [Halorubrum sp. Hd13]|uniref:trypsin-like serine peptidase n=1 Tax=Halorubrum sp. Hd13 TaxID=1480728 RepID=UPI000B98DC6F|nr:serine protease [Halorubrum sp. Hd13]OYR40676.1 hypothetical protein DJ81_13825 [Halorubrum sp. Hd13]